jgi:hypothetical protein
MNSSRFPVYLLIRDAIRELGAKWQDLLPALLLPSASMIALAWTFEVVGTEGLKSYIWWLAYVPFYVLFAVTCHRTVILGTEHMPSPWGIFWTWRETVFLGWFFGITLLTMTVSLASGLLSLLMPVDGGSTALGWIRSAVLYLFASYFILRFSMVLPASALDHRVTFGESWAATKKHGITLALAVGIPVGVATLMLMALDFVIGRYELLLFSLPYWLVTFVLMSVEIAVLSVAYKYLFFITPNERDSLN